MAEKCAQMFAVLVSMFAIFPRYVTAQRNSIDNQVKEAKDKIDSYTIENRRIPQNVMRVGKADWFSVQDRVIKYTMYPVRQGDVFLENMVSEIESNTCVRFKYVETDIPSEEQSNNTMCYVPDFSHMQSEPEQKIRLRGFRYLFRCLGKHLEHQRTDRDLFIQILRENIAPENYQKFNIIRQTVTQGLSYNYLSIMQLKHDAYSMNGLSTMIPLDVRYAKEMLGQSTRPTKNDYLDIQLTYCGTEIAAGPVTAVEVKSTYIRVKWPKPKYSPVKIRVDYKYSLLCDEQPYFTERGYFPAHYMGMNFTDLKPGSRCKLNFAVIYNPSQFDRGVNYMFKTLQLEPTAPPENVKIVWIKETSAKLSWRPIPCPHQHGRILRYIVRHDYELLNGTFAEQQSETYWNAVGIRLLDLRPNRNYAVNVAGVNEAGVGPFSQSLRLTTPGVCPGKVRITSIEASCHNITIQWIAPLDENDIPYGVRLKYSYKDKRQTREGTLEASCADTSWTVENIPSDTSVKLSLEAINQRSKTGPSIHTTVKTKKP